MQLRPYQRRALAHMLREERAEGGSARHLWVKLNLPETPGETPSDMCQVFKRPGQSTPASLNVLVQLLGLSHVKVGRQACTDLFLRLLQTCTPM
jgi:hypothetical protein